MHRNSGEKFNPIPPLAIANQFLVEHPDWQIVPPSPDLPAFPYAQEQGWIQVLPQRHDMDGFFMVKLQRPA